LLDPAVYNCACLYGFYCYTVDLASQGVACTNNNALVASSVSILFICCLPTQLPSVAADIRDTLTDRTLVFSVVTAVPVSRLQRLLGGNANVIRPQMETPKPSQLQGQTSIWDVSKGIESAFGEASAIRMTCPLSNNVSGVKELTQLLAGVALFSILFIYENISE